MEDRLTQVEMKLAYLEDAVMTLNDLVVRQGREMELLQSARDNLEAKLAELAELASDIPNRRPPHY